MVTQSTINITTVTLTDTGFYVEWPDREDNESKVVGRGQQLTLYQPAKGVDGGAVIPHAPWVRHWFTVVV